MNIYPQDLGPEMEQAVERKRAEWHQRIKPFPHPNILAGCFLASLLGCILFLCFLAIAPAIILSILAATFLGWYLYLAKEWHQSGIKFFKFKTIADTVSQPLTVYEVHDQHQLKQDPLMRSYLELVVNVIAAASADSEAEREVRSALKALGVAVLALPIEEKMMTDSPTALREEAAQLASSAEEEQDAVIGSSLRRRSESLARRADTTERTILLLRRNQALRQETAEQIDALRTSLTAFHVGGKQSLPEISALAASIQRVALEANAMTSARAEVDTILSQPTAKPRSLEAAKPRSLEAAKLEQPIFVGSPENTTT